ncbi:uncharacterized protein LOC100255567 isoform X2 [Vitis vinifera]|uniref:uncharacterized protein LOC100255567 isoform X2 n=2 Tax=Vitis vinifera TaxID=29760 RepID=UPI0005400DD9|nr:uncharacterized protein LOC100255567 isoform X2 [Vitis vinifera]XP_019076766.1 uncharacterized protein LOC100255567 isoform X2 [Vitis vinifera]|eukprot:XP_010652316.1 PREDICTED: uncharacterized protein LOC100255567 isoform X2 [Vitis vinifera]
MDLLIPNMRAFPISSGTPHTLFFRDGGTSPGATAAANRIRSPSSSSSSHALVGAAAAAAASPKLFSYKFGYSNEDSTSFGGDADGDEEIEVEKLENNGVEEVEIEKLGNNSRRIRSKIVIDANLHTVWSILTDYEGLADFIPGLAVSQLVEKGEKFARLFQIGQQDLAFGLKFNAKGIVDCYEKDLESLPFGEKRDIEFKMIEGDFQIFEGKWSIEQHYYSILAMAVSTIRLRFCWFR